MQPILLDDLSSMFLLVDGVLRGKFMVGSTLSFWRSSDQSLYQQVQGEISERRILWWFRVLQCDIVRHFSVLLKCCLKHNNNSSGWDIHDAVYSRELLISNRANGYRDIIASIDLSTYRRIPWENNVPFFLVSFLDPDTKQPLSVDPRGILKIVTERLASIGRECYSGVEYEVSPNSYRKCRSYLFI